MTHGTLYAYSTGCRCGRCKRAKSKKARYYHRRKMREQDPAWTPDGWRAKHGTNAKYSTGCRCAPCTEAHRLYRIEQNRRDGIRERPGAAPLRPLIGCMVEFGLQRRKIATVAGCTEKTLRLQRETVNAATADKIQELHWSLFRNHGPFRAHCTCEWTPEIRDFMESEMVA